MTGSYPNPLIVATGSTTPRGIADRFASPIDVRDYGAKGDGVTNDTNAIQDAINASAGYALYLPPATFVASGLTVSSNTQIVTIGPAKIQRPDNDIGNAPILSFDNVKGFSVSGPLTLDGNKENNGSASAQNCITINGCGNFELSDRLTCTNATGCGIVVQNSTDATDHTTSLIKLVSCTNNSQYGAYLLGADYIKVISNDFSFNTLHGLICDSTFDVNVFTIDGNTANYNQQSGIYIVGHKNDDPTQTNIKRWTCNNNTVTHNTEWGIIAQGELGSVCGNSVEFNGSSNAHAGIVINGYDSTFSGNVVTNNYYYGVDIGGAFNIDFTAGNLVAYNGNSTGGVGINVEGSVAVNVVGNMLRDNGYMGQPGSQIYLRGIGGAGSGAGGTPFTQQTHNVTVDANTIYLTQPYAGIVSDKDCDQIVIGENSVFGASSPELAHIIDTSTIQVGGSNGDAVMRNPVVASATSLIIPDVGNVFIISGTNAIEYIYSAGESRHNGRTWRFELTAGGSGYTGGTFNFTLGTGETGIANVYNGAVVSLFMATDAPSSGTFSFSVPGGSGTGATGNAICGMENNDGRRITLKFQAALTVQSGGNLFLSTNHTVGTTSILEMIGFDGNWYEVSYTQ